jgi:3-phosphoshikimate 1-carboxyvinyltransferase
MICVSIQGRDLDGIRSALAEGLEMAEIRLDRCPLSISDIETLFAETDIPLVATCRVTESGSEAETAKKLEAAIRAGAKYVDLEIEASPALAERIGKFAAECGTAYIRSFHDFKGTPSAEELKAVTDRCFSEGGDIAKIVTTAADEADCRRMMDLYDAVEPGSLLAFCMGEAGKQTRLDCLAKGAPYTYCALTEDEAAAPGQWAFEEMSAVLYGGRHFAKASRPVVIPCSKSYAQRAIIAAALADGESHLEGYSPCGDNESAIALAKTLGASIEQDGSRLTIKGITASPQSLQLDSVHVGESGFLTRMTIPLLAVLNGKAVTVTGEKTLVGRPLKGAAEALDAFGSRLKNAAGAESATISVPLTIASHINPSEVSISGRDGSQIISGLLAALPLADEDSIIHVRDPRSVPYLFMTEDVLRHFGIELERETSDGGLCYTIRGGQSYRAADYRIEGDWSSAANFLVAGAIFGRADIEGLAIDSLQADRRILEIISAAGATVWQEEEGPRKGTVHVQKAPLAAFEADANDCPDIFPILAVLAAFCEGTSVILGTGRLAGKESDRAKAILGMLHQMGVTAAIEDDCLLVEGHSLSSRLAGGMMLRGGNYTSGHDHRMVMALKVASLAADGPVAIDDTDCVAKSFPTFLSLFESFMQ